MTSDLLLTSSPRWCRRDQIAYRRGSRSTRRACQAAQIGTASGGPDKGLGRTALTTSLTVGGLADGEDRDGRALWVERDAGLPDTWTYGHALRSTGQTAVIVVAEHRYRRPQNVGPRFSLTRNDVR